MFLNTNFRCQGVRVGCCVVLDSDTDNQDPGAGFTWQKFRFEGLQKDSSGIPIPRHWAILPPGLRLALRSVPGGKADLPGTRCHWEDGGDEKGTLLNPSPIWWLTFKEETSGRQRLGSVYF